MQAVSSRQASLASAALTCSQHVRPLSSQVGTGRFLNSSSAFKRLPPGRLQRFHQRHVVRSAQREEFAEVLQKVKSAIPSVLKLQSAQPRDSNEVGASRDTFDDASEGVSLEELPRPRSIGEVLQAAANSVAEAPVQSVVQTAIYGGLVAFGLLISGAVLNSVESIPLAAEFTQSVGLVYALYTASQILGKKPVRFPPPSPFKAIIQLADDGQPTAGTWRTELQEELSEGVAAVLDKLSKERDTAVNDVEELRKTAKRIASVVAEKEALEAVALQLADERDGAMSEVSALKEAIGAMTGKIKAIEEMLKKEVSQLKEQNQALETVSLHLAAERDFARQEIEQLRGTEDTDSPGDGEKEALAMVAVELAQERDSARAEIEELKKVVTILREATSTSSGLTSEQEGLRSEQEVFINEL